MAIRLPAASEEDFESLPPAVRRKVCTSLHERMNGFRFFSFPQFRQRRIPQIPLPRGSIVDSIVSVQTVERAGTCFV